MSDVRPYLATDRDAVADLYRRAYRGDRERRLQAFQWITERNPRLDPESGYLLLWEDGRVAGYLGRSAVRLFVRGAATAAVYSQEALVDPTLRGRGVATTLFDVTNRTPRPMTSLWHNERIVSLLGKTGWTRVGPLPSLRKIYRLDRLAPTRFRSRLARRLASFLGRAFRFLPARERELPPACTIEPIATFGAEFDELFGAAIAQHAVIADRAADVLNWKYSDIPHQRYHKVAVRRQGRLRGYAVLQMQDAAEGIRKGKVIDLLADASDPEAMDALAIHCDRYFRLQDADLAACIVATPRFQRSFRHAGFRPAASTLTSTLWIRNQHLLSAEESALLSAIDSWYLTLGDSDAEMW